MLILIAFNFYQPIGVYSRLVTIIMMVTVMAALILNRIVLYFVFQWMMLHHGLGQSRTAVLGGGPLAEQVCRSLLRHPEHGMRPIGLILGRPGAEPPVLPGEVPVLGTADNLEALLLAHRVDE